MLEIRVADGSLLRLIGKGLHVSVLDGVELSTPESGTAQASVLSSWLQTDRVASCFLRPAPAEILPAPPTHERIRLHRRIRTSGSLTPVDVVVTDAVLAPGYGQMNAATMSAITLAARLEALILDPVYTGKSMAGMVALARDDVFHPGVNGDRSIYAHLRAAGQDCPSHTSHGMK